MLPVATFSYLYHTISGITLFRYWRLCESMDAPAEQREVVGQMVEEVLRHDPLYASVLQDPIPLEETPEYAAFQALPRVRGAGAGVPRASSTPSSAAASRSWWTGRRTTRRSSPPSVREILGRRRAPRSPTTTRSAWSSTPSQNRSLGETLTLTTHGKLSRALFHPSYTFRKKLSHTADSQDQRHRMTPASRPALPAYLSDEPDYIVPMLVARRPRGGRALPRDHGARPGRRSASCARAASPTSSRRTCCPTPSRSASPSRRTC